MNSGSYSFGKRQREAERARKKQEKAEKRAQRRERGPGEIELTTAEEITGVLPAVEDVMRALESGANASRSAAPIPVRLFVGGLSWNTTEQDLRAAFAKFGVVSDAVVMTDRDTGKSRGFGFVTMENRKDGAKAIDGLNGAELDDRKIVVNAATDRAR
jgi:RNA recognition motif-containing protein